MASFSGSPTKYTSKGTVSVAPPEPSSPREIPINNAPAYAHHINWRRLYIYVLLTKALPNHLHNRPVYLLSLTRPMLPLNEPLNGSTQVLGHPVELHQHDLASEYELYFALVDDVLNQILFFYGHLKYEHSHFPSIYQPL